MKTLVLILAALTSTIALADPGTTVIAEWNFNDPESLAASTGSGLARLLGGVVSTNFQGSSDDPAIPNGAISLKGFPAQGTSSRTAGLEFTTSATGWRNLGFRFEVRASGTASKRLRVFAAADGGEALDAGAFEIVRDSVFTNVVFDLSQHASLSGASEVAVWIVSEMSEEGQYVGVKPKADGSNSYSSAGTWRFDRVAILGSAAESISPGIPLGITGDAGTVTLSWPGLSGPSCTVWSATSLSGPWESVSSGMSGLTHSEPTGDEPRFFRITSP
ncbi:MAG TPA: hypothetical protein PLX89_12785 [Verrucomicrobiota bacterium]|nr:hypothetical protein [Verrucomicrobiales bacterium]HRI13868.1 hypothetical protein [Verrucomicrobiota bacterium]